ncbi:anaerobic sulfite reductase subunit A [Aequitasia blattaphilus]|uniref:Anaerobic sulfite reductase subunit AsrA n=1 Tax=Aequitasia blattaphilus TaxID=2949332 RepID=A0ABT1ECS2_9FIRM|nr:anaerobic sulfite reductase subunit AsrA [Aequitasia blattaphilus]MCP1103466.1 anaerobic sulfite reductase subunit AsrA [Aequitasia blattaphilus]MCR8616106.1 anaerobic sulfite reductase subunit AsrA [Aequitasia blattaphilus]
MGYQFNTETFNKVLLKLQQEYRIFAPKRFVLEGAFSDTDSIRYDEVSSLEEMELKEKSSHSFKEALIPASETLFYFTEDYVREANPTSKSSILFLRSCDIHALKRLDEIYLHNGGEDYFYKRLRENLKIFLIGCPSSFQNCFCVDMESNVSTEYDAAINFHEDSLLVDCKNPDWIQIMEENALEKLSVEPEYVTQNQVHVTIPSDLSSSVAKSSLWKEYDSRCIACGRCNYSCPTCTCFTMQDIFYTDNGKAGERRRVQASCMVDGFTDVAGGGSYRKTYGERMRFKVLHKVLDYKERFGYHMCVGCGRCDDVCPEYISFSNAINKLDEMTKEVSEQ